MVKYQIKVGNGILTFEGNSAKDAHKFGAVYGMLPQVCPCGSKNLHLSHRAPKGNDFYAIRCADCGAELNLHQKKDGSGLYVVATEKMEIYKSETAPAGITGNAAPVADDETPF